MAGKPLWQRLLDGDYDPFASVSSGSASRNPETGEYEWAYQREERLAREERERAEKAAAEKAEREAKQRERLEDAEYEWQRALYEDEDREDRRRRELLEREREDIKAARELPFVYQRREQLAQAQATRDERQERERAEREREKDERDAEKAAKDRKLADWLEEGRGRTPELRASIDSLERTKARAALLEAGGSSVRRAITGEGEEGALAKAMDAVDMGRSFFFQYLDPVAQERWEQEKQELRDQGKGPLERFGASIARPLFVNRNRREGDELGRRRGFGDLEALQYDEDDRWYERTGKVVGAAAGDITTDPFTYLTFGTAAVGRQVAGQAARSTIAQTGKAAAREAAPEVQRSLIQRVDPHQLHTWVAQATGRTIDDVAMMSDDALWGLVQGTKGLSDDLALRGLASGAIQSFHQGGSRGLRTFLTQGSGLGDDVGRQLWQTLPAEVRGGARFRVPFLRDHGTYRSAFGVRLGSQLDGAASQGIDLGVGLPVSLRLTQGGGLTSRWVPGLDNVLDFAEGSRQWLRTAPSMNWVHKVFQGDEWAGYVMRAMRDNPNTVGRAFSQYESIVNAVADSAIKDGAVDRATSIFLTTANRGMQGAEDPKAANAALGKAFNTRGEWDDAFVGALKGDERIGYETAKTFFNTLDHLSSEAQSVWGPNWIAHINEYVPRMYSEAEAARQSVLRSKGRPLARRRADSHRTGVYAEWTVDMPDPEAVLEAMATGQPPPGGTARIVRWKSPVEVEKMTGREVFETDPQAMMAQYVVAMSRSIREHRTLQALENSGALQRASYILRRSPYGPKQAEAAAETLPRVGVAQADLMAGLSHLRETGDPAKLRQALRGVPDGPRRTEPEARTTRTYTREDGTVFESIQYEPPVLPSGTRLDDAAADYIKRSKIKAGPEPDYSLVEVHEETGRAIARAYDDLPLYDEAAVPAFKQMAKEVERQYKHITERLGIRMEVVREDPYQSIQELAADIATNGRVRVLSSENTGGHPIFTNEQNDKFRFVHDIFGHLAVGRAFDRHGEEAAWLAHRRMFSPLARKAMTTETRGQNSALNFGGYQSQGGGGLEKLPADLLPPQKVALLPADLQRPNSMPGRLRVRQSARTMPDLSELDDAKRLPLPQKWLGAHPRGDLTFRVNQRSANTGSIYLHDPDENVLSMAFFDNTERGLQVPVMYSENKGAGHGAILGDFLEDIADDLGVDLFAVDVVNERLAQSLAHRGWAKVGTRAVEGEAGPGTTLRRPRPGDWNLEDHAGTVHGKFSTQEGAFAAAQARYAKKAITDDLSVISRMLDPESIPLDPTEADRHLEDIVMTVGRWLNEDPKTVARALSRTKREANEYGKFLQALPEDERLMPLGDLNVNSRVAGRLQDTFGPPQLARSLERMFRAYAEPDETRKYFNDAYRTWYTWWKTQATVGGGPRFFIRNVQGGIFNAWLWDVSPRHFSLAGRVLHHRQSLKAAVREEMGIKRGVRVRDLEFRNLVEEEVDRRLPGYLTEKMPKHGAELARAWETFNTQRLRGGLSVTVRDLDDPGGRSLARELDVLTSGGRRRPLARGDQPPGGVVRTLERSIDNPVLNNLMDATEGSETFLRFGSYLKGVEQFGLEDGGRAAGLVVKATQFDYSQLTDIEMRVLKQILPFYTWTRRNIPLQARGIIERPGKAARVLHANDALEGQFGAQGEDGDNAIMPRWVRESFGWEVRGLPTGQYPWAVNHGWWPTTDLNQTFLGSAPGVRSEEVLSSLNPMATAPIQTISGVRLFTRNEFQPTEAAPAWARLFGPRASQFGIEDRSPLSVVGRALFGTDVGPDGEVTTSPRATEFFRQLAPPLAHHDRIVEPTWRQLFGMQREEDRYIDRYGTSVASMMFGIPVSTLDPRQQQAEARTQQTRINRELKRVFKGRYEEAIAMIQALERLGHGPDDIEAALRAEGLLP